MKRSDSPYPVRNLPDSKSGSFSHDSATASSCPAKPSPSCKAASAPHATSCSRYPSESQSPSGGRLDRSTEDAQEGGNEEERQPLLGSDHTETAVYARRWYLQLLFSMAALMQPMSWGMWGPIAESAKAVFYWEDSQITMSVFLGNLFTGLCCIPFSCLMDHQGLYVSMVLSCFCVMVGAGLRCLIRFVPSSHHIWCIYGGQIINGMAGPATQGGRALFSSLWFPSSERATSTAVSTFSSYAGYALALIVGPLLVPSPRDSLSPNNDLMPDRNDTQRNMTHKTSSLLDNSTGNTNDTTVMMNAILHYLDYQAAAAAGLLLLVLVYFPDRPPQPPSLSAATDREDFCPGLAKLIKNKQFWLIATAFCLSLSVFEVWGNLLDVNLSTIGISQETAGRLGFCCIMAGCLTGLLTCRLVGFFFRHIRFFLILSYVVSALCFVWFILIYIGVLPFNIVSIHVALILSGMFLNGTSPLAVELMCEAVYPVGEGISTCFLLMLWVLTGMGFAAVQSIPNIGTGWMNWCVLATICVALSLYVCVTDSHGRADVDQKRQQGQILNVRETP